MTLLPWMTFLDHNGHIICTVPMRDVIRWQSALVYGPVVIRHFLDDAETPEQECLWTYERMIDRTMEYEINLEAVTIPLN